MLAVVTARASTMPAVKPGSPKGRERRAAIEIELAIAESKAGVCS